MVQALPHIQVTPPATVINRLARTVVGMVTDVTLALSVTPGAPATGLTRVGVDVEAPGRSAELWRPAGCCRRLHLGPWARHRARHACGTPSPHPLSTPLVRATLLLVRIELRAFAFTRHPASPRPHAANEENAALRKAIEDADYECGVGLLRLNQLDLVTVVAPPATVRRSATVPSPGATHLAIWTSSMRLPLLCRS